MENWSDIDYEFIICAAVWYKELPDTVHKPTNVDRGVVLSGIGHAHCINQMHVLTGKKNSNVGQYVDGFLTNKNRFVDRYQAAKIAYESGQIPKPVSRLFSEDLFSKRK